MLNFKEDLRLKIKSRTEDVQGGGKTENSNERDFVGGEAAHKKVLMQVCDLASEEYHRDKNGKFTPFFSRVTMKILSGEAWGISSGEASDAQVLCEILGSMRPYYSGKCKITPKGAMKKKRMAVSNVFYIDSTRALLDNMTVLEELMFLTGHSKGKYVAVRQEAMLNLLLRLGFEHLSLTLISKLYDTEKLLLLILIGGLSSSEVIILNALDYKFSQEEIEIFLKVVQYLKSLKKSLIVATKQAKLIGIACDKTLFLYAGKPAFCGSVEAMYKILDKVKFVLKSNDSSDLKEKLEELLPGWEIDVNGKNMYLFNYSGEELQTGDFYRLLADNHIYPEIVKINQGRAENSFIEIMRTYKNYDI